MAIGPSINRISSARFISLAVQAAYKIINPNKKYTLKYTTVQGVQGFEKEAAPIV